MKTSDKEIMEVKVLRLYITRHGETEWNIERRIQGWKNSNLTPKGVENAIALGNWLKDIDFNCIYSSSSQRTIHTAELIRGDRIIRLIPDNNLREINLGEWEGKTSAEFEELDNQGHKAFWETPHLYVPKSGESFFQVRDRIEAVLNKIMNENEDGNVLIVTHAVIVKTMLSLFKGYSIEKLWEPPIIHGTSLSIVEVNKNEASVILEGDMSHVNV